MRTALMLLATVLVGCGSGMKVSRKKLVPVHTGFTDTYHVRPVRTQHTHQPVSDLLRTFDLRNTGTDTVQLSITAQGLLTLNHPDDGRRTEQFIGTFSKRGYFEVYTRKEIKEVPPVVPIIHGRRQVNRIRLALSTDGCLVLDNKWENTANIFLMAGGGSGRSQYFFQPVR